VKPEVAVIGKGNVGSALGRGLVRVGCEVQLVGNEPARVRETAAWGEIVVLAVPHPAIDQTLREMRDAADGKTLVDASNAMTADFGLALGFTTSGAEELQKKVPSAKVVKAFNTVFAQHMDSGTLNGAPLTLFAAGDDAGAKAQVLSLGRDLGFDPVDAGPLTNARSLEALGYFNIQLGYMLKMGPQIGFALLRA
jgi:predicted dinucleotide-binding enzyme